MTVYVADGRPNLLVPRDLSRLPVAYGTGGSPPTSRCTPQRFPLGLRESRLFGKAIQWVDTAHYLGAIFETLDFVNTHKSGRIEGSTRQRLVMLSRIPRTGIKWLHEENDKTSSWFTRCRNWRFMSILSTVHLINYNMLANPPNRES
jgi:hypothetical protein